MKKIFLIAIAGMILIFSGCKSGSADPKTVLIEFMTRLSERDFDGARKLATADTKIMLDRLEKGMKTNTNDLEKFDKEKMEFGETKIEGDRAIVPVKEKESGEALNFILKKESGSWKVAFDKSTFIPMGIDAMDGVHISDSVKSAIEQMKNINMDSLENALKEGSKMMDSVAKELEKLKK
jgi:hypothetical protein